MTRLIRVELTRLWWRRLPIVAAVGLLVVVGLTLFGVDQQAGAAARALAGQDEFFNEAVADFEANGEENMALCLEDQERERELSGESDIDFGCEQMEPTVEEWFGTPPSAAELFPQLISGLSWVLLFAAVVIGGSATAREVGQRTLGTWLTFEPRRGLVYFSKLVAVGLWTLPLTLVLMVGVVLGTIAVLQRNGVPDGMTSGEWSDLAWIAVRLLVLAVVAGFIGAASGFVLRNVAILIGLLVGYAIAVESILAYQVESLQPWTVSKHVQSWLLDGTTWLTIGRCDESGCAETERALTLAQSSVYLGVIALVVTLLGYLFLTRTDVD